MGSIRLDTLLRITEPNTTVRLAPDGEDFEMEVTPAGYLTDWMKRSPKDAPYEPGARVTGLEIDLDDNRAPYLRLAMQDGMSLASVDAAKLDATMGLRMARIKTKGPDLPHQGGRRPQKTAAAKGNKDAPRTAKPPKITNFSTEPLNEGPPMIRISMRDMDALQNYFGDAPVRIGKIRGYFYKNGSDNEWPLSGISAMYRKKVMYDHARNVLETIDADGPDSGRDFEIPDANLRPFMDYADLLCHVTVEDGCRECAFRGVAAPCPEKRCPLGNGGAAKTP